SGSRRLWELLHLLRAQGNAVTFIALNGYEGDAYREQLEQIGVEVYQGDAGKLVQDARPFDVPQLLADTRYDVALLSFYYIAAQSLPELRGVSPQPRVVVDSVDLHFVRERRAAELGLAEGMNHAETRRRELAVYRGADAIVAVTEEDRRLLLEELPEAT